jgi:hypothetical protein
MAFRDLQGQRFGRLIVITEAGRDKWGAAKWWCLCDCGNETAVVGKVLTRGDTKSCGCYATDARKRRAKHRMGRTALYGRWRNMFTRCENPNVASYKDYGARGIRVCESWRDFRNFLADMGEPPPGHELDRIDNDKDYEPGNCRWVPRRVNANNKRSSHKITIDGTTKTAAEWSRASGVQSGTIRARVRAGITGKQILEVPK